MRRTKRTCYIFKITFFVFTAYCLVAKSRLSYSEVAVLLVIAAINIYREKYNSAFYVTTAGLACTCIGVLLEPCFGVLFCLSAFDFAASALPCLAAAPVLCELVLLHTSKELPLLLLITFVCFLFGYTLSMTIKKEAEFKLAFDRERQLRYELEQVKAKLIGASKEAARLAEAQERNRIAREIHDSVGHRTSAVLIELQAAYRLFDRHIDMAKKTVGVCVNALSETMELLRETVHNIKPEQHLGVAYIKSIIENFKFCPVHFKFDGDFGSVPPDILEILGTNIMESLTNAQKHSKATAVEIFIDINDQYTRLYIKDNGGPCPSFNEGMGLGGMRERIENIGGTMSVNGDDGFMIVCVIPARNSKGGIIA